MDTRIEHEKTSWLSKGYGLAPFLLMGDPRISVGAKGLFCYLSSIAGAVINEEFGGRASWPSRKRICRDLNINKDTFTVYLDELKRHGFIRVIQRRTSGKFSCNVYVIQEYIEPLSRKREEKSQLEPCPNLSDAVLSEPISSDTVFSDATNTNDLPLSDRTMITSMNSAAVVAASCRPKRSRRKATDNLERALDAAEKDGGSKVIKEGIEMVYRQFKDILKRLDVTEIESMGKKFDPNLHNAVMHVKDERYGENEIIEVFQKGYILKDKVIRHSMVKVAN